MNDRLKHIYTKIKLGAGVLDVGTDHGYIPISLASDGYPGKIYASDINELPLNIARANALKNGVAERIEFVLTDGIKPEILSAVDAVVIAGMGGDTICHILDNAYESISSSHIFYLQPMSKQEILRYWLINNGFEISDESAVYDNDRLYHVISARLTGINSGLSDAELFTGKFDPGTDHFHEMLDCEMARAEKRLAGLISGQADEAILNFNRCIVEDMHRMKEQLNRYDKSRGYL